MKNFAAMGAVAAYASALVLAGAAPAAADSALHIMKPKQGISFDAGSRRAVGYFLADGGICNLTVLLADTGLNDEVKGAATRVSMPVIPKKAARIDTIEGKTLEFSCAASAQSMTVKVLDQVAFATAK